MSRGRHKNKKRGFEKLGQDPGTIFYVGTKESNRPAKLDLIEYNEAFFQESTLNNISQCNHTLGQNTVKWLNVDGVYDSKAIAEIGKKFSLHPLLLEDVTNTLQRPKVDEYENVLFVVAKMLRYDEIKKCIEIEQVSLVLGENFLISFQEDIEGDLFDHLRIQIRNNKQKITKSKADYLLYLMLDIMVDHYFVMLEKIGEEMDEMEDLLISDTQKDILTDIYRLKRELILLRKNIWPMREMLGTLERADFSLLSKSSHFYFRDIYDHAIQAIETIEMDRDMLSGMMEIYLTTASNRLNSIMKVLTTIYTIFIPLTFIVGVYGMNFDFMPELHWKYGYLSVWVIMITTVIFMIIYFKRKKWF